MQCIGEVDGDGDGEGEGEGGDGGAGGSGGKAEQLVGIAADIKQLKIIQIQSDKSCR